MPRVAIKKKDYKVSDFSKWLVAKMYEQKLTQADMGKLIGITQPAFCNRLEKGLFSYSDMLTLFKELKASDAEILTLMKM
ncbi:MAG: hypothetical protein ACI4ES_12325 [Roseburia sp.]